MSLSLLEVLATLALVASVAAWQLQAVKLTQISSHQEHCEVSLESVQRYHAELYWLETTGVTYCGRE